MPVNLIIRNPLDWDALAIARNANGANRRELSDYVRSLKSLGVWSDLTFFRDFANAKSINHSFGPNITFTRGGSAVATYFDAGGTLRTAGVKEPRFDHDPATGASRGLLVEEARTNSIRNSQAGGATAGVIGSGGVMPTNWSLSGAAGVTTEVVRTGTLSGFNYIDFRFSGTPSLSVQQIIYFDITWPAASVGQSWTASAYAALIAGNQSNATNLRITVEESSGSFLAASTTNLTSISANLSRFAATRTFNNAGVTKAVAYVIFNVTSGQPIDLTLRIAAPQLEQGAFPTSYIPTTTAEATRSADSAVVTPISSFYNQAEGTLFAEYSVLSLPSFSVPSAPFSLGRGLVTNDSIFLTASYQETDRHRVLGYNGTSLETDLYPATAFANGVLAKAALALKTDDFALSINGATPLTDSSGILSNQFDRLSIGERSGGSGKKNGHLRKIAYYPKRLSNALLQQLTT